MNVHRHKWPQFGALALYGVIYAIGTVGVALGLHRRG